MKALYLSVELLKRTNLDAVWAYCVPCAVMKLGC